MSEKRDVRLYLDETLEAIDVIFEYTRNVSTLDEFLDPNKAILRDAVIRNLIVIGEAVKGVMRQKYEEIPDSDRELWSGLAKLHKFPWNAPCL